MSKQKFAVNLEVELNTDYENNTHSLTELVDQGLTLAGGQATINAASGSIAEHMFHIALGLERKARKEKGTTLVQVGTDGSSQFMSKNKDDLSVLALARAAFEKLCAQELARIQVEKGWEGKKLPAANDSALRKLVNAWENGFSLEYLGSCSKAEKANTQRKKEQNDALLAGSDILTPDQKSANDSGNGVELTGNAELDAALMQYIENMRKVAEKDSKTALSMVNAAVAKSAKAAALHVAGLAAAS